MTTPPPLHPSSSTSTPSSSSFVFPLDYAFPPFFTRQTNLTTRHAQLTKWAALVLSYCHHYRLFKISLSGNPITATSDPGTTTNTTNQTTSASASGGERDTTELFYNRTLNRRLSPADIRDVIAFLRKDGRAEYVLSPTGGSGVDGDVGGWGGGGEGAGPEGGDIVWVYWRTPEEWASLVEGWVDSTGQKGGVLTVYELVEGDGTRGTEFHGMDQDLLLKALNVLVKRGKAQIFGQEDSLGVKFF
ncbi:ESCRT-II complex subunit-domain-containing protein [Chaetomium sp. MPI-SDFR-AT-0129]|nr:ESCRT-II complex subunit-domain-containing protein [Chaetomium sp. MPI-SDFR-AT-0129]